MARNLRMGDVYFGWRDMETILLRDEARTANKQKQRTELNTSNINLDQYTMMNTTYAKAPFNDRTICEVLNYLSIHLNVKLDWEQQFASVWHKYHNHWLKLNCAINEKTIEHHKSNLILLGYKVSVHGIFVERMPNVNWKTTRENIKWDSRVLTKILAYFTNWVDANKSNKGKEGITPRMVESYCLSLKTYKNLLTLVKGYMSYAKEMLKYSPVLPYIPALHCNQSSIEGLFSCMLSMGKDRTDRYASGILQQSVFKLYDHTNNIHGNTSYPQSMVGEETNHTSLHHKNHDVKTLGSSIGEDKLKIQTLITKENMEKFCTSKTN